MPPGEAGAVSVEHEIDLGERACEVERVANGLPVSEHDAAAPRIRGVVPLARSLDRARLAKLHRLATARAGRDVVVTPLRDGVGERRREGDVALDRALSVEAVRSLRPRQALLAVGAAADSDRGELRVARRIAAFARPHESGELGSGCCRHDALRTG